MKDPIYLIIIILLVTFFTGLTISCYKREKQLEMRLAEAENYLSASEDELYKTLLQVQNHIEENNNLQDEIDDLKSKNIKLIKRNEGLSIEINDLKNEIDELSNKNKTKITSEKTQTKPSFTPKVTKVLKETSKIENKSISVTNNDIKAFINESKRPIKKINNLLSYLRRVDEERVDTSFWKGKTAREYFRNQQKHSRSSSREITCRQVGNETTDFHYKIVRKLKNLPEDNSTIQFRKILLSIDQNLKIVIDNNNAHKQATTKGEWDTCTYNALKAVENINNIIENYQYIK